MSRLDRIGALREIRERAWRTLDSWGRQVAEDVLAKRPTLDIALEFYVEARQYSALADYALQVERTVRP
jgi:hypothetical protein